METARTLQRTAPGVDISSPGERWLVTVRENIVRSSFATVLRFPAEIREWARRCREAAGGGIVYLLDARGGEVPPRVGSFIDPDTVLWPEVEGADEGRGEPL